MRMSKPLMNMRMGMRFRRFHFRLMGMRMVAVMNMAMSMFQPFMCVFVRMAFRQIRPGGFSDLRKTHRNRAYAHACRCDESLHPRPDEAQPQAAERRAERFRTVAAHTVNAMHTAPHLVRCHGQPVGSRSHRENRVEHKGDGPSEDHDGRRSRKSHQGRHECLNSNGADNDVAKPQPAS